MSTFWGLFFYMAIGGVLAAAVFNSESKKCGGAVEMKNKDFVMIAISWPATLTAVIVIKDEYLNKKSVCVLASEGEAK